MDASFQDNYNILVDMLDLDLIKFSRYPLSPWVACSFRLAIVVFAFVNRFSVFLMKHNLFVFLSSDSFLLSLLSFYLLDCYHESNLNMGSILTK